MFLYLVVELMVLGVGERGAVQFAGTVVGSSVTVVSKQNTRFLRLERCSGIELES